jgi:hypothetical protein
MNHIVVQWNIELVYSYIMRSLDQVSIIVYMMLVYRTSFIMGYRTSSIMGLGFNLVIYRTSYIMG